MSEPLAAMLSLSAAHEVETSRLDQTELTRMLAIAFHSATARGGHDGFLIAFDQDAAYASANFRWFQARYDRFVYIDRIIVAGQARRQGIARGFYEGLFERARAAGHRRVVCEVNLDPPNPVSVALHAAMGFTEVGQAVLAGGKRVSYQHKPI